MGRGGRQRRKKEGCQQGERCRGCTGDNVGALFSWSKASHNGMNAYCDEDFGWVWFIQRLRRSPLACSSGEGVRRFLTPVTGRPHKTKTAATPSHKVLTWR